MVGFLMSRINYESQRLCMYMYIPNTKFWCLATILLLQVCDYVSGIMSLSCDIWKYL